MTDQSKLYPELFEYYPSTGIIEIYNCVKRTNSDFDSLLQICKFLAMKGKHCIILPKSLHFKSQEYHDVFGKLFGSKYEGKCPDLLIDGEFYEHEGFTSKNNRKAFRNMVNRGLRQSSKIIIEDCNLTDSYMLRAILKKQRIGIEIEEVRIINQKELRLLYKAEKQRLYAAPVFNESVESLAQK